MLFVDLSSRFPESVASRLEGRKAEMLVDVVEKVSIGGALAGWRGRGTGPGPRPFLAREEIREASGRNYGRGGGEERKRIRQATTKARRGKQCETKRWNGHRQRALDSTICKLVRT